MQSNFLVLIILMTASCAEPVVFNRNNNHDPGNPEYIPHPPLNLTLSRSGRDMVLQWFVFPGGSDSVWIQKSIKGSNFETIARVPSTASDYRDRTHDLDYPSIYRLRSVYQKGAEIRISEPSDVNLPVPITGVQSGEPVGVFSVQEAGIGGNISNLSRLYDRRIRYESPEYSLVEYVNYASTVETSGGRDEVYFTHRRVFELASCPFIVDATLQLTLPSADGNRVVQENPITGSPFTIPFMKKDEQFDDNPIYIIQWRELRSCQNCLINVHLSTDQGNQWTFLEHVQLSAGVYEHTHHSGKPWYRLSMDCNGKAHPDTLEYRF